MERATFRLSRSLVAIGIGLLCSISAVPQPIPDAAPVPPNFTLDLETAARLRPELMAQSIPATGPYATGRLVFDRLIEQLPKPSTKKFAWELRIIENESPGNDNAGSQFNAYSSPDGTIYVESALAQLAGPSSGLWAAILSHEIAHVIRRDWARRYLYQKSLESGSAVTIVLGDPGLPSAPDSHWSDSQKASDSLARFCRQLEIDADREGLMLMARAGYHPDFVPALHHLLHAQGSASASLYAMHPCWEERDKELNRAYTDASIEFEHRWREWYASPGGNPPTVVFADAPTVRRTARNRSPDRSKNDPSKNDPSNNGPSNKKSSREWEIEIPMRCENLVGAVEVVLRAGSPASNAPRSQHLPAQPDPDSELRQLTGCTSPRTTVIFTLDSLDGARPGTRWSDVYVLDAWGAVLARAEVPKLPR